VTRNLSAIALACFIGFAGFTLAMPLLPLYFAELGMEDAAEIALWSGLSLGVTPGITALLAPLWGRLADRYGHKFLVLRSLVSFTVTMVAMGFATRPWHIVAIRVVQGLFAGYGALAVAMAAASAPRGRVAAAIGVVQTAQRLGPTIGPVLGGALAYAVGVRWTFFVSAGFYALALLLVWLWYDDPRTATDDRGRRGAANARDRPLTFRNMLALQHLVLLMGVIFSLQLVERSFGPVLPVWLAATGVPDRRVPLYAGLLFSTTAAAGAAGNLLTQHLLHRYTPRTLLRLVAGVGCLGLLPFVGGAAMPELTAGAAVFGLAIGVGTTAAFAAGAHVLPERSRAAGFGLLSSASLVGLSLSPALSGVLARISIRSVFIVGIVTLAVLGLMVNALMRTPAAGRPAPSVDPL